jgi:hypothetical protein
MSSASQNSNHYEPPSESIVTLADTNGRSLECYVEHSLEVEGSNYLLLLPTDYPVEIVIWDNDERAEATFIEDEAEVDAIFADAQAVMAEQNLTLKRTAYTLTVEGELPPANEEEILTLELEDEATQLEPEEFQYLASFYHQEQEYEIYTPLDPLLFFAREDENGNPELLSPEEFKQVQPLLEDLLFDDME